MPPDSIPTAPAQSIRAPQGARPAGSIDDPRYWLRSRSEVLWVLRELHKTRAMLTMTLSENKTSLLTTIVAIDADAGLAYYDTGSDQALNRQVAGAGKIGFNAVQERIRIHFTGTSADIVDHDGHPAFRLRLPDAVFRLQRREFFRLPTPVANPLVCVVSLPLGDSSRELPLRLHDISLGGVALIAEKDDPPADATGVWRCCRIALPGMGTLVVDLEPRNQFEMPVKTGKATRRIGCRFVQLRGTNLQLLQRYVMKLERERSAKA